MSSIDLFGMAVRNLFKRKLRTFLTVLGVVIGTTAIVVMVSLGLGINESFEQQMKEFGDLTTLQVYRPYEGITWDENGNQVYQSDNLQIDDKAIAAFNKIEGVVVSTPVMEMGLTFVSGKYKQNIYVKGMYPEAMEALGYEIGEGRLLDPNAEDMEILFGFNMGENWERIGDWNAWRRRQSETATVDMMNDKMSFHFDYSYGEKDSEIKRGYNVTTAGILAMVEGYSGYDVNYSAFMNIEDLKVLKEAEKKYNRQQGARSNNQEPKGYDQAYVKCSDIETVSEVLTVIRDEMGFTNAYSNADYVNEMKKMSGSLQGLLGAIGAVSLFVAAIGIANTMIMAIYERTKEIGVMKVIGASLRDIRRLFLLEAAMIGFMGGLFGIGLSLLVSYGINTTGLTFLQSFASTDGASPVSSIPIWLCGAALGFSSLIGLISGYFPALRAMKLSALSAIHTE